MKNKIINSKVETKNSNHRVTGPWQAHRLQPDVKNFGISNSKKKKNTDKK